MGSGLSWKLERIATLSGCNPICQEENHYCWHTFLGLETEWVPCVSSTSGVAPCWSPSQQAISDVWIENSKPMFCVSNTVKTGDFITFFYSVGRHWLEIFNYMIPNIGNCLLCMILSPDLSSFLSNLIYHLLFAYALNPSKCHCQSPQICRYRATFSRFLAPSPQWWIITVVHFHRSSSPYALESRARIKLLQTGNLVHPKVRGGRSAFMSTSGGKKIELLLA